MSLSNQIAQCIKQKRKQRGLSLDQLAKLSGVSRAMISKIEREVSTPTAVLLARLADALGTTMTGLMAEKKQLKYGRIAMNEQTVWTDLASGYSRRVISAAQHEGDVEIVAVELPAHAHLSFPANSSVQIEAKLVLMEGKLHISAGSDQWHIDAGDCLQFGVHAAHTVHNPHPSCARYMVVMRHTQLAMEPQV